MRSVAQIENALKQILEEEAAQLARETGFIERERNLSGADFAQILNKLAIKTFDSGLEVRVIMPRFGTINERRHRLHEVVRLSGINIIIDGDDYPLIIKVASGNVAGTIDSGYPGSVRRGALPAATPRRWGNGMSGS